MSAGGPRRTVFKIILDPRNCADSPTLCGLSLFASLPANLCSVFEREQACGAAIAARQARDADPAYHKTVGSGSAGVFQELDVGTPVMLRWVPEAPAGLGRMGKRRWGQSHFRWVACKVVALDRVGWTVEVREVASPYNSVFSNSGIGVGFSMTVLISFVSVWSGRKKGFLLKKFSQRSVKGSLTC